MLYDILNIDYQKGMERRMVFQRIRDMREDADLKQNDMAKILHCSQQAYSNYELGQRDIPTDILRQLLLLQVAQLSRKSITALTLQTHILIFSTIRQQFQVQKHTV